mgnify:CR=1 FL=1
MGKVEVTFILQQPALNQLIKEPLEFGLDEGASIVDAIKFVDERILERAGRFPLKGFKSLLHMTYNPLSNRFYRQVAIQGYARPGSFLNLRENPKEPLPSKVTIVLVPDGPCISEWEDVVDW